MAQRPVDQVNARLDQQSPGQVILTLPGTDYQLHLVVDQPVDVPVGKRVAGRILATVRRVDLTAQNRGGGFIEPVWGRPRRVHGRVMAVDGPSNTLTVRSVCPFVCKLMDLQKASDFKVGDFVMFDIERGARFVTDQQQAG